MNLLIDTHILLWYISGDRQLPKKALNLINDDNNNCYISIATIWEIVIKMSLNKLEIKGGFETIEKFLENNDFELLPIKFEHIKNLLTLPFHHNDPFDRVIITQSMVEDISVITKDKLFRKYDISTIW